jgi:hypothetical protein
MHRCSGRSPAQIRIPAELSAEIAAKAVGADPPGSRQVEAADPTPAMSVPMPTIEDTDPGSEDDLLDPGDEHALVE